MNHLKHQKCSHGLKKWQLKHSSQGFASFRPLAKGQQKYFSAGLFHASLEAHSITNKKSEDHLLSSVIVSHRNNDGFEFEQSY